MLACIHNADHLEADEPAVAAHTISNWRTEQCLLSRPLRLVCLLAAGIAGGIMQKNAIDKGASQARDALNQGITTATNQLRRWATSGLPANADQADLLGLNGQPAADAAMAKFQSRPGYQLQLGQGLRAVDAGAAARGCSLGRHAQGRADVRRGPGGQRLRQLLEPAAAAQRQRVDGGAAALPMRRPGRAADREPIPARRGVDASIYGNMAKSIGTSANG